eukprot:3463944-Pyramimonas_sp.AAC.1
MALIAADVIQELWQQAASDRHGERCRAEGHEGSGACTRCTTGQKQTMAHRVGSCPCTCAQDHRWIRQSAKLCDEAVRDITNGANLGLWLRGLLPPTWNTAPPPPAWGTPRL